MKGSELDQRPQVLDIGQGQWAEGPDSSWVSKSDVTQFHRCAYKVYLSFTNHLAYNQFLTPEAMATLVQPGVQFEDQVIENPPSGAKFEYVDSVREGLVREGVIKSRQLVRNHNLGYQGIADLIIANKGEFIPIEVKSHKKTKLSDRLELAFYWRLFEPLRNREMGPKGFLLLSDGSLQEVRLNNLDFWNLDNSVANVRKLRVEGTEPAIVPECKLCMFKEEHQRLVHQAQDVSLIRDVGSRRRLKLFELGIKKVGELAEADPHNLWAKWSRIDRSAPPVYTVRQMHAHAVAWVTGEPQYTGESAYPFLDRGILFDLEYESGQYVFLVGAEVFSDNQKPKLYQWLANREADERTILESFCQLLAEYPNHHVITWSGKSADIPQLKGAWIRCGLPDDLLADIVDRHIDAYQLAYENIRLPVPDFELSTVSEYFGHRRKHRNLSGMDIPYLFREYLRKETQSERNALRAKLLRHNKDDLNGLLRVWKGLQEIVLANLA